MSTTKTNPPKSQPQLVTVRKSELLLLQEKSKILDGFVDRFAPFTPSMLKSTIIRTLHDHITMRAQSTLTAEDISNLFALTSQIDDIDDLHELYGPW